MADLAFGPFALKPAARTLLKDGEPVPVTAKVLDTLIVLVQNRGRVMSKDELFAALWPDTTVEEANLTQNISTLRKVLGDDAKRHRYIATIAGRGYSFIAPVTETPPEQEKPHRRPAPFWAFGVLALLAVALIGWMLSRNARPGTPPPDLHAVPLTTYPGTATMPAFSPDGLQVVYVRAREGALSLSKFSTLTGPAGLYVRLVQAGAELRLTSGSGTDMFPAWSPDGQYIAFFRSEPKTSGYYVVSALGGPERRIPGPIPDAPAGLDWLPDSKQLVVSELSEKSRSSPLTLLSIETGERRPLTSPPAGVMADVAPAVSPDGKRVAFIRVATRADADIYTVPLNGGPLRRITSDHSWKDHISWMPDSRELVFSAWSSVSRLWRVSADGGACLPFTSDDHEVTRPAVAPRGGRLAYVLTRTSINLWVVDLSTSNPPRAGAPRPLIASTRTQADARYSPDGTRIAFASDRSGSWEIWTANAAGEDLRQVTHLAGRSVGSPAWSPDGRSIAFDAIVNGNADIWMVPAGGGALERITSNPAEDDVPGWSHDSEWIYFGSNRAGDFNIWKVRRSGETESNPAIQVTRDGGFHPVESGDGEYLYFARGRGKPGLFRRALGGNRTDEEPVLPALQKWGWWALTRNGICFLEEHEGALLLRITDPAGTVIHTAGELPGQTDLRNITATSDTRHVVYDQTDAGSTEIMLIDNFR